MRGRENLFNFPSYSIFTFSEIEKRIEYFPKLEQALDSNELMIKYRRGFAAGTVITAEYIIIYDYENTTLHYFIEPDTESGKYIGKSFFDRTDNKFFAGQQSFKVLKKYKKNVSTGIVQILADKEIKRER